MIKLRACIVLFLMAGKCFAQDTLEQVLARMKPDVAVQIAYHETRHMSLFANEWHGSGYLYAALPDTLLKQQLKPEVEIMAAEGTLLTYQKPSTQTFHQLQLDQSNPMMASLVAFKAMLTGDLNHLRQLYTLKFIPLETAWQLEMTAKQTETDEASIKIILRGISGHAAYHMKVIMPDGDRSDYQLMQVQQGQVIKNQINDLLQSLQGY